MSLQSFSDAYSFLKPRTLEIGYHLRGAWFKVQGTLKEIVFYDALEPTIGTRIVLKTYLDDFDIELNAVEYIKEVRG